jgi:hypothetical protein
VSLPAAGEGPHGEGPHAPAREGFADWVTFAFAAAEGAMCGVAEIELGTGPDGEPLSAGHALILREGAVVAAEVEGPAPAPAREWAAVSPAGVRTAAEESGERWAVGFAHPSGYGFELRFAGVGDPVVFDPEGEFVQATGAQEYERLCHVTGTVTAGGHGIAVDCLGQRGHRWGASPTDRLKLVRRVGLWLEEDLAVVVGAARVGRAGPEGEVIDAFVLEGDPPVPGAIDEARLSTTYDAEPRPVRASLELWPSADADMPRRAAGRAIATAAVAGDDSREHLSTFFEWWMEGRAGLGHYALVRRQ